MNTPDSTRVEVTPELLTEMEAVAQDRQAPARTPYEARVKEDNFRRVVNSRSVLALVERIRELESAVELTTTYACPHGTAPSRVCALCNPEPTAYKQGHAFTAADIFVAYVTGGREASQLGGTVTADLLNRAGDAYVKSVNPLASDTSS